MYDTYFLKKFLNARDISEWRSSLLLALLSESLTELSALHTGSRVGKEQQQSCRVCPEHFRVHVLRTT
jgi:hypothetical protein